MNNLENYINVKQIKLSLYYHLENYIFELHLYFLYFPLLLVIYLIHLFFQVIL